MKMHYDMMKMSQKEKHNDGWKLETPSKFLKRNISTFDIDPPFDINN